jgi:hypothetical protein
LIFIGRAASFPAIFTRRPHLLTSCIKKLGGTYPNGFAERYTFKQANHSHEKDSLHRIFCFCRYCRIGPVFPGLGHHGRGNTRSPEMALLQSRSKYLLRYNAEVFAEFGYHPTFRWVTELQYNVKGAKVAEGGSTVKYQNQYAAWNNYLMIRKELFSVIPYAKIGPRLEYVFGSDQSFSKFHLTGAAGAGVEFVAFGPVKFITEAFWVPDATRSYKSAPLDIRQHCWELRIGIKIGKRGDATCPAYKDQPND